MMTGAVVRANNTKKKSLTLNFVHVQTDVYVCVCVLIGSMLAVKKDCQAVVSFLLYPNVCFCI